MRGVVDQLAMPYPLHTLMPSVFQEDEFTVRWLAGLDDVLAPVVSTLDCLVAYVDPATAPEDFLDWLADWFGIPLDENLPSEQRRAAIAAAVPLHRTRGTPAGLAARLALASGCQVDVTDSGGVAWSQTPDTPLPGADEPWLRVVVTGQPGSERALDELITADKPAHVPHELEVFDDHRLP
jgi:phage tail-like protein